jgi:hypothetical protein
MITAVCKPCRTPVAAPEPRAAASALPPGCLSATDVERGIATAAAAACDGCFPADSAAMCIILHSNGPFKSTDALPLRLQQQSRARDITLAATHVVTHY